jgi:hypothetical protein
LKAAPAERTGFIDHAIRLLLVEVLRDMPAINKR